MKIRFKPLYALSSIAVILALCPPIPRVATASDATHDDDGIETTTVFQLGERQRTKFGFRIPALAVARSGMLLAFCERRVGLHDHAQNDIVLRRSRDGGHTWGPLQVIAEEGGDSLNDPCVVVLESGRILLRYTRFPQGVHARKTDHTVIAEPGYDRPKNVRLFLMHSDDEGHRWSTPRDVTRVMRREPAISLGSPGVGLQLSRGPRRGRVLFPNYEVYHLDDGRRRFANSVSWSDDGGETWHLSDTIAEPDRNGSGDEAQLAELSVNRILLTARDHNGGTYRRLSQSGDGGETWSTHRVATDLLTPPCMSSILRYSWPSGQQPGVLLHSLPHTKDSRSNGTIMISRDEGASWNTARVIVPGSFAYSCLAQLPDGDVGCLYETAAYSQIVFKRLPAALLEP